MSRTPSGDTAFGRMADYFAHDVDLPLESECVSVCWARPWTEAAGHRVRMPCSQAARIAETQRRDRNDAERFRLAGRQTGGGEPEL